MTAMVFCDLSLGSDRTLIMRRVIVHRIDVRRRYLAIFSERRVGNDGWSRGTRSGETRNTERGTLNRAGSVLTVWSSFQLMFRPTNSRQTSKLTPV